ncbi:MAG: copper-binding protein, partial [Zoogloeaceae bacterium]|nr:copper-binding protein [Zoogloeaceae bacterium]
DAQIPEVEAAGLRVGSPVEARLLAFPNAPILGRINALIPELQRETRTVRVRIQTPNPEGRLRPGMFARIRLPDRNESAAQLLVPTDAVIVTGKRHLVIVATDKGRFVPVEVTPGQEADNRTEILAGLQEGEKIVVSGQFMIDSEASLRGTLARMDSARDAPEKAVAANTWAGTGVVNSVTENEIVLAHKAIPELQWPAMTMPFPLAQPGLAAAFSPGQSVRFSFSETETGPVIQSLHLLAETAP